MSYTSEYMTKAEAHELLDSVRNGADIHHNRITHALRMTGDMIPSAGTRRKYARLAAQMADAAADDLPIIRIHRPVGTWEGMGVTA